VGWQQGTPGVLGPEPPAATLYIRMRSAPGGVSVIDLEHMGRPESVAACLLETPNGPAVVDPGPSSTLPRLRAALARHGYTVTDLSALLLTHIHLDHAGASGTLARENPKLRVYVHSAGAPHVADPSKLLSSATRLYGSRMEELWGEVAPVAPNALVVLEGGEAIDPGGRRFEVAYTPGHAWHHVSYFEPELRAAFVGDTAGIFGPRLPLVLPVTPPPDFDLEAWLTSIDRILAWEPRTIFLTHYGPSESPQRHFEALRAGLIAWATYAKETLDLPGSDENRIRVFVDKLHEWMQGKSPSDQAGKFLSGAGPEACWQGLARYWRKRA
jgi:glyoxylase-like metal-dependent hydrolase (beta-lactamase superfamily II)